MFGLHIVPIYSLFNPIFRLVFCQSSDILQELALTLAANIGLGSNIATLILYFILWVTIKGMANKEIFIFIIYCIGSQKNWQWQSGDGPPNKSVDICPDGNLFGVLVDWHSLW